MDEETVTLSRSEYDEYRQSMSELYIAHQFIRIVLPMLLGTPMTEEELTDIKMGVSHFKHLFLDPKMEKLTQE